MRRWAFIAPTFQFTMPFVYIHRFQFNHCSPSDLHAMLGAGLFSFLPFLSILLASFSVWAKTYSLTSFGCAVAFSSDLAMCMALA
jgi:hypothetical protein